MSKTNNKKPANQNDSSDSAVMKDYIDNFVPAVHRIGRLTMAVSFAVVFFPVLYFYFVKGFQLPFSSYLNTMVAIASIGIGMWLTEPLAYWPVLGSAGTYMAYLSGNVSGMRFPVALNVQSSMNADINTPRGQVATIIGIVGSIFINLIILLIIVLGGNWLITVLPDPVLASFSYVMPCLFGSMWGLRFFSGKTAKANVSNIMNVLPYIATAIICKLLISNVFHSLAIYGTSISVGVTILVAYILYRIRLSKGEHK